MEELMRRATSLSCDLLCISIAIHQGRAPSRSFYGLRHEGYPHWSMQMMFSEHFITELIMWFSRGMPVKYTVNVSNDMRRLNNVRTLHRYSQVMVNWIQLLRAYHSINEVAETLLKLCPTISVLCNRRKNRHIYSKIFYSIIIQRVLVDLWAVSRWLRSSGPSCQVCSCERRSHMIEDISFAIFQWWVQRYIYCRSPNFERNPITPMK